MAVCPDCETAIDVDQDDIEEGQKLECPECGAELEIVNTNPLELDLVVGEEEEEEETF